MANEATVIVAVSAAKGGMNISSGQFSKQITMTGNNAVATPCTLNVAGGAGTQIPITACSNAHSVMIRNRSATDNCNISYLANMATIVSQCQANSAILLQPPAAGVTLYGLSQSANTVDVAAYAFEL